MLKKLGLTSLEKLKTNYENSNRGSVAEYGRVTKIQFQNLIRSLDTDFKDAEIQLLFFVVKPDPNGCINLHEFIELMKSDFELEGFEFIENLFAYLDRNCSGTIDFEEFTQIADIFNEYTSEEELRAYFNEVDANGDGKLSFEEFENNDSIQLMNKYFLKLMSNSDVTARNIFAYMDRDNDGLISFEEFKRIADFDFENTLDEHDLRESFARVDTDNDGKLTLADFSNFVLKD